MRELAPNTLPECASRAMPPRRRCALAGEAADPDAQIEVVVEAHAIAAADPRSRRAGDAAEPRMQQRIDVSQAGMQEAKITTARMPAAAVSRRRPRAGHCAPRVRQDRASLAGQRG